MNRKSPESGGSPARSSMRGMAVILLGLVVLIGGSWGFRSQRAVPPPVPASAPDTVFSAQRALTHLSRIAQVPRSVGSPEHTRVRQYLLDAFEEMGIQGEVQTAVHLQESGTVLLATSLRNVMARIPGSSSSGTMVLTTHYDGAPLSPAAGDAGMALVVILEVVRALQSGPPSCSRQGVTTAGC